MHTQTLEIKKQSGAVLVVALIMVLLMTIVGLASIRGSGLQEQMAGNMRDRNLAFQASESALREGESLVATAALANVQVFNNTAGLFKFDAFSANAMKTTGRKFWAEEFDWTTKAKAYSTDIAHTAEKPSFVLERVETLEPGVSGGAIDWASVLDTEPEISYRVTARAAGGTTDTVVILQSTYK